MANQNVKINIGSSYDGSGMAKALGAVNTMSGQARKAAGAVGQLAGAFEGLGGKASKAVGAIAGGLGAIATGGIFGAIIFGVTTLVSWLAKLGEQQSPIEQMKKNLEGIKDVTDKITTSSNNSVTSIEKMARATDALAKARVRLENAQAEAQKAKIDSDIDSLEEDGTDEGAARNIMKRAAAEKTKVQIDADTAKRAADAIVESMTTAISTSKDKIGVLKNTLHGYQDEKSGTFINGLDQQKDALDKEVAEAKRLLYVRRERRASEEELKKAEDQLKDAAKAYNDFINNTYNPTVRKLNDEQKNLTVQEANLKAAEQERTNVLNANSKKLELADKKYIGATVEAANARERSKIEEEQLVAEQEANAATYARRQEIEAELEAAAKQLAQAELDAAAAQRNAANAANAAAAAANGGIWNPNGVPVGGRGRPREGAAANNGDNAGFNDFAKPKGWEARFAQTHPEWAAANGIIAPLSDKDEREKARLVNKMAEGGYENLSDKDKAKWDDIKKRDPEYLAQKAEEEAKKAREKVDNIKDNVATMKTSLENIDNWLKELKGGQ